MTMPMPTRMTMTMRRTLRPAMMAKKRERRAVVPGRRTRAQRAIGCAPARPMWSAGLARGLKKWRTMSTTMPTTTPGAMAPNAVGAMTMMMEMMMMKREGERGIPAGAQRGAATTAAGQTMMKKMMMGAETTKAAVRRMKIVG
jgi:hypothetical protein